MKKTLGFILFCTSIHLFAQNPGNKEVQSFLQQDFPTYVSFKDSAKLDINIRHNYDKIKKFLAAKTITIEDCWVDNQMVFSTTGEEGVDDNGNKAEPYTGFPIIHVNSLYALIKLTKEKPEEYKQRYKKGMAPGYYGCYTVGKEGMVYVYQSGKIDMEVW